VMAGGLGARVALVEKYRLGGECLNTGCVPSKALIHAGRVAHLMRRAGEFGLRPVELSRADASGALEWVRRTIDAVRVAGGTEALMRDVGVEILFGDAHFTGPDTLALADRTLKARAFLLATGSSPAIPDVPGLAGAGCVTNTTMFDLPAPPESLLVIGGGPIGVEMAQAFQRLGTRVTLVQRGPRLLPRDDAELTGLLGDLLRAEGVDVRLNTRPTEVEEGGSGKRVTLEGSDGSRDSVTVTEILAAAGRLPNVDGLNLAAAGVRCDPHAGWVTVDHHLRTTGPTVWAVGDVTGRYQFSHMAEYEAKLAVWNLLFPLERKATYRITPWATFTDPELARVGDTEEDLQRRGVSYTVLRQEFAQDDRALTDGEGVGAVKVLVEAGVRTKILGAHILGPRAGELIQEWVLAMQKEMPITAIADLIHVYPTLSMASQHAAQRWYQELGEDPRVRRMLDLYFRLRGHESALAAGAVVGAAGAYALTRALSTRGKPDG
jgi:pyruvate/2-oxoglutarate dehydrogenase complex dihydrolipoamide dehydrogenase (E3) component